MQLVVGANHCLEFSGEGLVQQRLFQCLQRGELPLVAFRDTCCSFGVHFFVPARAFNLRNCFFHDVGGARHMPSGRTNAHTLGRLCLAQMFG